MQPGTRSVPVRDEIVSLVLSMKGVADLEPLNVNSRSHVDLPRHSKKNYWLRGLDQTPSR